MIAQKYPQEHFEGNTTLSMVITSWKLLTKYLTWDSQSFKRFEMADYVIFLTTLYEIIFLWWSYPCNSDQDACWTWILSKVLNLLPHFLMSWNDLALALALMLGASPSSLTLMGSPGTVPNIMGMGFTIPQYITAWLAMIASKALHVVYNRLIAPRHSAWSAAG